MPEPVGEAVVVGHVCLDVIPDWPAGVGGEAITPGALVQIGAAHLCAGGAVANTGGVLRRLGVGVSLVGRVGDDLFGQAVRDRLGRAGARTDAMVVAPGEATSYTVVINPPGVDRTFLHCPGTNDDFDPGEVDPEALARGGARLLHFGYPPLMRRVFADGGVALAAMFERAKAAGLTTSLDMAFPDPASEAAGVDWAGFLARVLPHVDLFLPSLDEMTAMIGEPRQSGEPGEPGAGDQAGPLPGKLPGAGGLAARLLEMGAGGVVIKMGDRGLYGRFPVDAARIAAWGAASPEDPVAWAGREVYVPCYEVEVAGTTGAGDATVAGLLAGLGRGRTLGGVFRLGVGAGACCVEASDASSGVPSLGEIEQRLGEGWASAAPAACESEGWMRSEGDGVWLR